mgnify:CR=1 FL=1
MLTMYVQSSGAFLLEPRQLRVVGAGAKAADDGAPDTTCCMICGCPGGPCTLPTARCDAERQAGCPFELRQAALSDRTSRRLSQPLSIATASLLLAVGFIYLAV